jgi:hypothetical protein
MNRKEIKLVGLALLVASALAACGATPEPRMAVGSAAVEPMVEEVLVQQDVERSSAVDEATSSYASAGVEVEQMIIWNADLSLTVEETKEAMKQVQAVARNLGGRTSGSESWLSDDQLYARLTIRVPAEQFEDAMAQLRDLATEVNRESANSEDVTDQYVDLASRLRHLEAKEAQLLDFLNEAEDTESVLAVYEHLAGTQAEIEQVKGRMAYLEQLSAMATITVELYPEKAAPTVIEEQWKPGFTLRNAARALVNTLEALADGIIWLAIYLLPVLLLIALPIAAVLWTVRRWRRRRRQTGAAAD